MHFNTYDFWAQLMEPSLDLSSYQKKKKCLDLSSKCIKVNNKFSTCISHP